MPDLSPHLPMIKPPSGPSSQTQRHPLSAFRVYKFGGTSVGDHKAIGQAASIVASNPKNLLVVLSAMGGITDLLLTAADRAVRGQSYQELVDGFRSKHRTATLALLGEDSQQVRDLLRYIDETTEELQAICQSLKILRESTKTTQDRIAARGERTLSRIFQAVLAQKRIPTTLVDGTELITLEKSFGTLFPDLQTTEQQVQSKVLPLLESGQTVIVPGYIGTGPHGELVTLGRGGSDLSATVLGHCLKSQSVTLYKEVDGLLTADPKCVKEARIVPELHYREAAELAYYGAKVLHPRTMIPLLAHQIPLIVRPTMSPELPGTRIAGDVAPGAFPVKALTAIREQSLVSIEGGGMMGVPGVAARTFQALAQAQVSVSLISQGSSEASICLAVSDHETKEALVALQEAFKFEMKHRLIDTIRVTQGLSIVAIVGLGMSGTPGIASRTFGALGRSQINIKAIAQGSSELNISLVIETKDVDVALQYLHREFRLEKLKVLTPQKQGDITLAIMGLGKIGRTLTRQIIAQDSYLVDKMGIRLHCVGVADRAGFITNSQGISHEQLTQLIDIKETGHPLKANSTERALWDLPVLKGIYIDTTAEDSIATALRAIRAGWHVVFANKKPLAVDQGQFDELLEIAKQKRVFVRYEATVGAGLPILDTLAKLQEVGDKISCIEGCFSGTLGFLMTELSQGVGFSDAVTKAYSKGYTEPDPREDLSGMDVARKVLILARTIGIKCNLADIPVECLYPKSCDDEVPKTFLQKLTSVDSLWRDRIQSAKTRGIELRYVGRIVIEEQTQGSPRYSLSVGLREVPQESPLGRLKGTDNLVLIKTERYNQNPLVVSGPGAGAEVTAAGVFNDILAIAIAET